MKVLTSHLGFLWHHPHGAGGALYCLVGLEVQDPQWSPLTQQGGRGLITVNEAERPGSPPDFLRHHPWLWGGDQGTHHSLARMKSRLTIWSLLVEMVLQLFLWSLAGGGQLSKSFLSCWTAPFLVLWLERTGFSCCFCS